MKIPVMAVNNENQHGLASASPFGPGSRTRRAVVWAAVQLRSSPWSLIDECIRAEEDALVADVDRDDGAGAGVLHSAPVKRCGTSSLDFPQNEQTSASRSGRGFATFAASSSVRAYA